MPRIGQRGGGTGYRGRVEQDALELKRSREQRDLQSMTLKQLSDGARLRLVDAYRDGVIWALVEDALGCRTLACIDRRADGRTKNRLFEGSRRPERAEGKLVPLGAAEEGVFVCLLSQWADDFGNTVQTIQEEGFLELIQVALDEFGLPQ